MILFHPQGQGSPKSSQTAHRIANIRTGGLHYSSRYPEGEFSQVDPGRWPRKGDIVFHFRETGTQEHDGGRRPSHLLSDTTGAS